MQKLTKLFLGVAALVLAIASWFLLFLSGVESWNLVIIAFCTGFLFDDLIELMSVGVVCKKNQ